jgi:hypothetical protein
VARSTLKEHGLKIITIEGPLGEFGLALRKSAESLACIRLWTALTCLLAVDCALILLHILWSRGAVMGLGGSQIAFGANRWFNLGQERGYAEMKELACVLAAAALIVAAWLRARQSAYLGLAGIFCFVIGDNLFQFHEKAGIALAGVMGRTDSSLIRHVGEFGAFIALGVLIVTIFVVTYRRSSVEARHHALIGLGIVGLLAAFAVGVDALHALLSAVVEVPRGLDDLFTLVEDGGETISISFVLAFAVALHRHVTHGPRPN